MRAARIQRFGSPEVIDIAQVELPRPGAGEVLIRVHAAGVGPWDAWIRRGESVRVPFAALPLTLGSDLAGTVVERGPGVSSLVRGDEVFGVTNPQFCGAHAEFALARAVMLAKKPRTIDFIGAAAAPVVAVTAWQMLFEHARLRANQTVLVLGGSGSVGTCAVQLAHAHGARVLATTSSDSADARADIVRRGASAVIDARHADFNRDVEPVDIVIDTVGGALQAQSLQALKPGGVIVSAVSSPDAGLAAAAGVRGVFFIVAVGAAALERIAAQIDRHALAVPVGSVLPLQAAREAHRMLDGELAHARGKIVLTVDA